MSLWDLVLIAETHAQDREAADNIVSVVAGIASLVGFVWGLIACGFCLDTDTPFTIMLVALIVSFLSYFICCWIHSNSLKKPILVLLLLGGGSCLLYFLPANNFWFFDWDNIFFFQFFIVTIIRGFLPD